MVGREGLHRPVLLDIFDDAGGVDCISHLATGNVSFDIAARRLPALIRAVNAAMTDVVGRDIEVFVRPLDHLRRVDAEGIYATAPFEDVRDRLVTYFHKPPGGFDVPAFLQKGRTALLELDGTDLYSATTELDGRVGAPGGRLEKLSGQRVTTRSWSTVRKIIDAHG